MKHILVQCSICGQYIERTARKKYIACFECKRKRIREFQKRYKKIKK